MYTLKPVNFRSNHVTAFLLTVVIGLAVLLAPTPALAHKVNVFGYVEGNTVITESYFNDGRKCRDCIVEVLDDKGNKLLEGKTDEQGRFSFRPPVRATLLIRLKASMGHLAEYTIPVTDLPESLPEATAGVMKEQLTDKASKSSVESPPPSPQPLAQAAPESAEIEKIIDRSVARQLEPIRRALEEDRNKQRISDIVGGIGYIIGLMGLVAYFRSKQRQKQG